MFSGTPRIPRGQGRGHGRGSPLLPMLSDASRVGKAVLRSPTPPDTTTPSPAPQTPDDARASRAALAADETIHQSATPAASPPLLSMPPPSAHRTHQTQWRK
ncbi:UNVERIFIED_CONTAM: hypothetical protein Sindi_2874800, partial [Sesamum indicum]